MRRIPAWPALLCMGLLLPEAHAATYPGVGACSTTLQACVDAAASGDTIELATNTPINEIVTITRDLTLTAAAGFEPVVDMVIAMAANDDVRVTVTHMTGATRLLGFLDGGGGNLDFLASNNRLEGCQSAAVSLRSNTTGGPYGRAWGYFNFNTLTQTGTDCAPAISVSGQGNTADFGATIGNNTIVANGLGQNSAVELYAANAGNFGARVDHNTIRGTNFNTGIELRSQRAGTQATAYILNNLITGQTSVSGGPGALSIYASAGAINATVLFNTLVFNNIGLNAGARTDQGGSLTGVLANNVFAHHTQYAFGLGSEIPGFAEDHNLVWDSPLPPGVRPLGAHSRLGDPAFVDPETGNFRLLATSAAIDNGNAAYATGVATVTLDLDNQNRAVREVDMGAYEFQGVPVVPPVVPPAGPPGSGTHAIPVLGAPALAFTSLLPGAWGALHLRRRRHTQPCATCPTTHSRGES